MKKAKLVLTGSVGNVGSKLIDILSKNFELFEIDINFDKEKFLGRQGFKCNIANYKQLKKVFKQLGTVKYVVHLAADSSLNADWDSVLENNIIGTRNVYECAKEHNIKRVVFASSNHVTGGYEGVLPTHRKERSFRIILAGRPIRPDSDYGTSKAFGEAIARQYYELYGIESVCLRLGTVILDDLPTYNDRVRKTWLSKRDLEQLVLKALTAPVKFGIYYGVSNNKGRFWDISKAQKDLDYNPVDNASLI